MNKLIIILTILTLCGCCKPPVHSDSYCSSGHQIRGKQSSFDYLHDNDRPMYNLIETHIRTYYELCIEK